MISRNLAWPSSVLRRPVTRARLAWHLTPLSDEYDTITVSTWEGPRSTAQGGAPRGGGGRQRRPHPLGQRRQVRSDVCGAQLRVVAVGVALVQAKRLDRLADPSHVELARAQRGAAVGDPVLCAGRHRQAAPLDAAHLCRAEPAAQCGVFGEALIGPAPAQVESDRGARREDPVDAARGRLARRERAELLHQALVPHAALPDVVREQGRVAKVRLPEQRTEGVTHILVHAPRLQPRHGI